MFKKILIAHRDGNSRQAVAAKPSCTAREARTGDLCAIEVQHV
jgi:hypothetical protein